MVGSTGVYRRKAGLDPQDRPVRNVPTFYRINPKNGRFVLDADGNRIEDTERNEEIRKFVGAPYFDHAATVVSMNNDGSVNLHVHFDPVRDGIESQQVRQVPVSQTLEVGSFTPNTPHVTVAATDSTPATTGGEA